MNNWIEVTIDKVIDGDTMKVKLESGFIITVRLLLIDTPEFKFSKIDQQLYGFEASEFAKQELKEGDIVYLEFENNELIKDKFDRYLCYLFYMKDGKYLLYNEEIVKVGLAKMAYILMNRKYYLRISEAQKKAKNDKINIWSIQGYVVKNSFDMTVLEGNSEIVYLKKDAINKIYHKFYDAHNIKNVTALTIYEAKKLRYKPCKHCFK